MFRKILCLIGLHPQLNDTGLHTEGMARDQRTEEHAFVCPACGHQVVRRVLRWPYNLPEDVRDKALSPEEKVKYGL